MITLISTLIFLLICIPMILVSIPAVAIMLLTKWSGYTTIFGNAKWGRANNHFAYPTSGWWEEFNWLVLRNPVNNLMSLTLGAKMKPYTIEGNPNIGEKIAAGSYTAKMGWFREYYLIKPHKYFGGNRCLRVRLGWKIKDNDLPKAAFVFAINPWKPFSGAK